jgi:aryl-alcohol dehydrogenase-like predicted oxidoreductase
MKYLEIKSGTTCLSVSKLAMGTAMNFARISNDEVFKLLDLFVEAGGNCIDTARVYGDGRSEEILGQWMKARGNRNRIVVSTKGCHPLLDDMQKPRLSRQDMENDFDLSLKALQTDFIDIYWIHKDDPQRPPEEIIENLNHIMRSGKIKMIGCSNWHVDRIEKANQYARKNGLSGFLLSQIQWNLAHTYEEYFKQFQSVLMSDIEYEWYRREKMPVFAYGSQASGFFAKVASHGIEAVREEHRGYYESEENMKRLEKVKEYAQRHNVSVSAVVLGYIVCNKLPSVAVFGTRNAGQLRDTLLAADFEMDPGDVDDLYQEKNNRLMRR